MARPCSLAFVLALAAPAGCNTGGTARPPEVVQNLPGPPAKGAPAAAREGCPDPIAGVWKARVWREDADEWDEVMLTIERAGATLRGDMVVTTWDGDQAQTEPPRCPDGLPAISRVAEQARGSFDDGHVDFAGEDPRRVILPCGVAPGGRYNPDHFTGELDPDSARLILMNDDGNVDQGRPHVFTRTRCKP